ncbi:hypothetical protein A2U01_0106357, partial [Trifolium medium]|nr:hypothetical protein [Trifolium medium]
MNYGVNFLAFKALPTPVVGVTQRNTCSLASNSK